MEWTVEKLGFLNSDADMLRLVFENLIGNALKFTSTRDVAKITIGRTIAKTKVELFIKDNGVGFDPKYTKKLFGVFQRLHSQAEFPGTGIGLANVKRIITNHGGDVAAEGETDNGATFKLLFPVRYFKSNQPESVGEIA